MYSRLFRLLGIESFTVSHTERLVSAVGGVLVIFFIFLVTRAVLGESGTLLIVPSMGASAVLLFAVPHGALSQPWNVLGGHIISASIGVTCAIVIPDQVVAASLAVGIAIGAMYYLRCIHPPGGATALAAVIGGEPTHALGYQFVVTPVLMNVMVMLAIAIAFNYLFKWRRYPAWLADNYAKDAQDSGNVSQHPIEHADLVAALSQIDSLVSISEHDLLRIYEIATAQADERQLQPEQIIPGHYYSNGRFGNDWSVRQIIDASPGTDRDKDMVVYKCVAGTGLRHTDVLTRAAFARWARHEVIRDDENWKRADTTG